MGEIKQSQLMAALKALDFDGKRVSYVEMTPSAVTVHSLIVDEHGVVKFSAGGNAIRATVEHFKVIDG